MFAGKVPANKNIWIIGDIFLTDAAVVLTQTQIQNRDELYLYQAYDVQVFYPKKQCTDSFGKIIRSTLYEALNMYDKLPAVIIVATGNADFDDKVSTPFHTKRIWKAVCTEIDRALKARKNDLQKKSYLNEEPRVFFTNAFPRYKDHCEATDKGFDSYKTKRRRLNNILSQILTNFGYELFTITGIVPDNPEYFVESTKALSGKGMSEFWKSVSRELKISDEKLKERIKSNIIKAYLENKQDQQRLRKECNEIRNDRLPRPQTGSRLNLDRGDHTGVQRSKSRNCKKANRSHSASR